MLCRALAELRQGDGCLTTELARLGLLGEWVLGGGKGREACTLRFLYFFKKQQKRWFGLFFFYQPGFLLPLEKDECTLLQGTVLLLFPAPGLGLLRLVCALPCHCDTSSSAGAPLGLPCEVAQVGVNVWACALASDPAPLPRPFLCLQSR